MAIEDVVLQRLLDRDVFEGKDPADGIARRGRDVGYNNLSDAQKRVINPLMTLPCDGVFNPADEHNECTTQLVDAELVQAIDNEGYYEGLLCNDCRAVYHDLYE